MTDDEFNDLKSMLLNRIDAAQKAAATGQYQIASTELVTAKRLTKIIAREAWQRDRKNPPK